MLSSKPLDSGSTDHIVHKLDSQNLQEMLARSNNMIGSQNSFQRQFDEFQEEIKRRAEGFSERDSIQALEQLPNDFTESIETQQQLFKDAMKLGSAIS